MINLLPDQEKVRRAAEQRVKITSILWFLAGFFMITLLLLLVSVHLYLRGALAQAEVAVTEHQIAFQKSETKEQQRAMTEANAHLAELESFYREHESFADIVSRLATQLPDGVSVTRFSAEVRTVGEKDDEREVIALSLQGRAAERSQLFTLRQRLAETERVTDLTFPPENWVTPTNISFTARFHLERSNP